MSEIAYAEASIRGPVRELNEDYGVVVTVSTPRGGGAEDGLLAVIADGMGGHDAGDTASRTAVETFVDSARRALAEADDDGLLPDDVLRAAMQSGNRAVHDLAIASDSPRGMGTTLTAVLILGNTAWICHVGDSRAYLLSGGRVRQLTTDDSLVQSKVDQGLLSDSEARRSSQRNVLLKAVGTEADVEPQLRRIALPGEFALLLTTDGLHGAIGDHDMREAMAHADSPREVCEDLIERAVVRDGSDNLSAIALRGLRRRPSAVTPAKSRPNRRATKWMLAGVIAVAAVFAAWIWMPQETARLNGIEPASPPPDLWLAADVGADEAEVLVLELQLDDGRADVRYRSPTRSFGLSIGDSGRHTLTATGVSEIEEVTIEAASLSTASAQARTEQTPRRSEAITLRLDADEGRWQMQRTLARPIEKGHRGVWIDGTRMRDDQGTSGSESGTLAAWPREDVRLYVPGPEDVEVIVWLREEKEIRTDVQDDAGRVVSSTRRQTGSSPSTTAPAASASRQSQRDRRTEAQPTGAEAETGDGVEATTEQPVSSDAADRGTEDPGDAPDTMLTTFVSTGQLPDGGDQDGSSAIEETETAGPGADRDGGSRPQQDDAPPAPEIESDGE